MASPKKHSEPKKPAAKPAETKLTTEESLASHLRRHGADKVEVWRGGVENTLYYVRLVANGQTRLLSVSADATHKSIHDAVATLRAQARF